MILHCHRLMTPVVLSVIIFVDSTTPAAFREVCIDSVGLPRACPSRNWLLGVSSNDTSIYGHWMLGKCCQSFFGPIFQTNRRVFAWSLYGSLVRNICFRHLFQPLGAMSNVTSCQVLTTGMLHLDPMGFPAMATNSWDIKGGSQVAHFETNPKNRTSWRWSSVCFMCILAHRPMSQGTGENRRLHSFKSVRSPEEEWQGLKFHRFTQRFFLGYTKVTKPKMSVIFTKPHHDEVLKQ